MNLVLQQRNSKLSEEMDDPACDKEKLAKTYQYFERINKSVSGWRRIYQRYIKPQNPKTLLDIGCGGGDVVRAIANWARQDKLELAITAIDPNEVALAFAKTHPESDKIIFRQALTNDLIKEGKQFDIVISNHVLHHLSFKEVLNFCHDSQVLAKQQVIHNDLCRSDLAYLVFTATTPFFGDSFITGDGLTSIRRSFTRLELQNMLPTSWQVKALFPYRNLVLHSVKQS